MSKGKVIYTEPDQEVDEALEYLLNHPETTIADDSLPSPQYFAKMLEQEKISLNIDKRVVDKFREYAKSHGLKYQPLMNQVLSYYADHLLLRVGK